MNITANEPLEDSKVVSANGIFMPSIAVSCPGLKDLILPWLGAFNYGGQAMRRDFYTALMTRDAKLEQDRKTYEARAIQQDSQRFKETVESQLMRASQRILTGGRI